MIILNANYTFDIDFEISNKRTSMISSLAGIEEIVQEKIRKLEIVEYNKKK